MPESDNTTNRTNSENILKKCKRLKIRDKSSKIILFICILVVGLIVGLAIIDTFFITIFNKKNLTYTTYITRLLIIITFISFISFQVNIHAINDIIQNNCK